MSKKGSKLQGDDAGNEGGVWKLTRTRDRRARERRKAARASKTSQAIKKRWQRANIHVTEMFGNVLGS